MMGLGTFPPALPRRHEPAAPRCDHPTLTILAFSINATEAGNLLHTPTPGIRLGVLQRRHRATAWHWLRWLRQRARRTGARAGASGAPPLAFDCSSQRYGCQPDGGDTRTPRAAHPTWYAAKPLPRDPMALATKA
jgi:hypothetical protein